MWEYDRIDRPCDLDTARGGVHRSGPPLSLCGMRRETPDWMNLPCSSHSSLAARAAHSAEHTALPATSAQASPTPQISHFGITGGGSCGYSLWDSSKHSGHSPMSGSPPASQMLRPQAHRADFHPDCSHHRLITPPSPLLRAPTLTRTAPRPPRRRCRRWCGHYSASASTNRSHCSPSLRPLAAASTFWTACR